MFNSGRPTYTAANLVADNEGEQPQLAIIYGAPDSGKTTLAAKMSDDYNLVWIDLDRGFQAAINVIKPERLNNVILIQPEDNSMKPNGFRLISKLVDQDAWHKVCVAHGTLSCIPCTRDKKPIQEINLYSLDTKTILVIDSLTRLADSALIHASGARSIDTHKKMEFDHWDSQGLFLRNIFTKAKQLPCHKIFISHEEEVKIDSKEIKIVPIAGTRANSRRISQFADHTIYTRVFNRKHVAYSSSTSLLGIQVGSNNQTELEKGDDILSLFKPKHITEEVRESLKQFATLSEEELNPVDEDETEDETNDEAKAEVKVVLPTKVSNQVPTASAKANSMLERLANRK